LVLLQGREHLCIVLLERRNELRIRQYPELVAPDGAEHDSRQIERIDAALDDRLEAFEDLRVGSVVARIRVPSGPRKHGLVYVGVDPAWAQQRHPDVVSVKLDSQ